MLITVSSSIILGVLIYGFLQSVLRYMKFKELYGESITYGIPSVKQAKRYAELKGNEYRCITYAVAILIVFTIFVITY